MQIHTVLLTVLTATALTGTPALAQMNHSMHGAQTSPSGAVPTGLAQLTGKTFDRAYLSMMIAHHQGAIDMSQAVKGRLKDPQVKTWAAAVIRDQTLELTAMNGWLRTLGGIDTARRSVMAADMNGMVTALTAARNPDQAFVQGMLPHHASALDMANLALQRSSDARVLKLSRDIIKAQADEMYAFKLWLARSR
ncbi:hypothetical protein GCM10008959_10690 [Deinococcus seoulensis]|uniref:DUF305 domain-containing protein n=1 Tax=Deinococcus seoulensis TaxID=1837379 RepID=A0ABQ2RN25_9DEIO|nr:DUF305 domain-containing protein [Deinococcus seoulensis]GGR51165.1 hypothetical protein GCM10008959_10690 [Deinococcus seoulensis]